MKLWKNFYVEIGQFHSKSNWINKATSWMEPGDRLVDSAGREHTIGGHFNDTTVYPVKIMRRAGIETVEAEADTLESRIQDMWHKLRDGRVCEASRQQTLSDIDEIKLRVEELMRLIRVVR